jgi:hypothetical protein
MRPCVGGSAREKWKKANGQGQRTSTRQGGGQDQEEDKEEDGDEEDEDDEDELGELENVIKFFCRKGLLLFR